MEEEGIEQQILLQPEFAVVGAVYSVNGYTGHVVLKTSDLENDSGYQTANDVISAISTHNTDEEAHPYIQGLIDTKQDTLTAGTNIQISEQNVISATDTTYSAGNGINISGENAISVDTTVVATQQNLANEVTNRENADIALQAQIDGISASSDVVDIIGTYAELQQYDTQHLKDNDIIKVLQDETQGGATTYYRWSTATDTFTLIGQEGPYYTKAAADSQFVPQTRTVNGKSLSSNITLNASDVSALGTSDVVQTTGTSTSQVMSQNTVTTQLNLKLNASDYIVDEQLANSTNPVQNQVLNNLLGNMPTDFFSGSTTSNYTGTNIDINNALSLDDMQIKGDTFQQTYSGKNLFNVDGSSGVYQATKTISGQSLTATATANGVGYVSVVIPNSETLLGKSCIISFSAQASVGDARIRIMSCLSSSPDIVGSLIADKNGNGEQTRSFTFPDSFDSGKDAFAILFYPSTSNITIGDNAIYSNIQLELGSTATSFEPYVGGTASPNPDYPQDIDVVTGEQTIEMRGKNLFNIDSTETGGINTSGVDITAAGNWRTVGYIRANPNTAYTFSVNNNSFTTEIYVLRLYQYDENHNFITPRAESGHRENLTITTEANTKYLRAVIYVANTNPLTLDLVKDALLMLEKGSTATDYEPYQSQSYTIDLGSTELCKIGTYQDYIYKSGDDWYVHKDCGKTILSSTNDWRVRPDASVANCTVFRDYDYVAGLFNSNAQGLSTHFRIESSYSANVIRFIDVNSYGITPVLENDTLGIVSGDNNTQKATKFKTWLSNNIVSVYYPLATPTDTKITDNILIGELEAVLGMTCYAGDTYVAISSSNLAGILELTAINANANGIMYKLRNN